MIIILFVSFCVSDGSSICRFAYFYFVEEPLHYANFLHIYSHFSIYDLHLMFYVFFKDGSSTHCFERFSFIEEPPLHQTSCYSIVCFNFVCVSHILKYTSKFTRHINISLLILIRTKNWSIRLF